HQIASGPRLRRSTRPQTSSKYEMQMSETRSCSFREPRFAEVELIADILSVGSFQLNRDSPHAAHVEIERNGSPRLIGGEGVTGQFFPVAGNDQVKSPRGNDGVI